MKKMYLWIAAVAVFLFSFTAGAQSLSATYTAGDIPTSKDNYDPTCNGPLTTVSIPLPSGGPWEVTGIDIEYDMTAQGGSWMSEQRSLIHFQNSAVSEATDYSGVGNSSGVYSYDRTGVSIANGIYAGNTNLIFEMHAWRTFGGSLCDMIYAFVNNNTWTITVHYITPPTCIVPTNVSESNITDSSADFTWDASVQGTYPYNWAIMEEGEHPNTDVPFDDGATASGITTVTVTGLSDFTTYDFYVQTDCGATDGTSDWVGPLSITTLADCTNYALEVTSTTDGSVCDEGSATLQASSSGVGNEIFWYDAEFGGNFVGFGSTFETPSITQTTSYWASEVLLSGSAVSGQGKPAPTGTATFNTSLPYGIIFDVQETFTLISVDVYADGAGGEINVELWDAGTNNIIGTVTEIVPPGDGSTPYTINLNFTITPGNDYRLIKTNPTSVNMVRDSSGNTYPYLLGASGEIFGGVNGMGGSLTAYYWFFNWTILEAEVLCESVREEAIATVHETIDVDVTATDMAISPGGSTTLTASSTNTDYTYVWNPGNLSGASVTVSPTQHTTYTATATDTVTGCVAEEEIEILVFDTTLCANLDVVSTVDGSVCEEGEVTLEATGSTSGNEIYWYDDEFGGDLVGTGSTFETPFLTETTSYWAADVLLEDIPLSGQAFEDPLSGTTGQSTLNNYGLIFNVTKQITIIDVEVFSTSSAGGDIDIELRDMDDNNNAIAFATATLPAGGTSAAPIPVTVPLNFVVPPGNYRLLKTSGPQMKTVTSANNNFPYPLGDSGEVITGSTSTGTTVTYYYFYNWTIAEQLLLCESDREEVIATVHDIIGVDVTATDNAVSPGGSTTLTASSTNTDYTYVWNPGNLSGASVTVSPTQHTTYTVTATDSVTGCVTEEEIEILVFDTSQCANLDVVSTVAGSVCGEGVVTLEATGSTTGDDIYWYDDEFGGNYLGNGTTFETPHLTQTTSFWASDVYLDSGGSSTGHAKVAPVLTTTTTLTNYGLQFDVTEEFTLISVDVYPTTGGMMDLELRDSSGTVLETETVNVPTGDGVTPVTITLNIDIPVGNGLRLLKTSSGSPTMIRESSGNTFPYPIDTFGEITGGALNQGNPLGAYYWFYNWTVSSPILLCESDREEVIATVHEIIEVDVTATDMAISPGGSTTLTASSTNTDYTYEWNPGNLSGASVTVSPTQHTTYTVTATDSVTGCTTEEEIDILVFDLTLCNDLEILTTQGSSTCVDGTATVSATAGGDGDEIYWYDAEFNGNLVGIGPNFESPAISQTTSYWAAEVLLDVQTIPGPAKVAPIDINTTTLSNYGLAFEVFEPFTIKEVDVYHDGAGGDITVELRDGSTVLETTTVTVPAGTGTTPYTVTLDFEVEIGTYSLMKEGSLNIVREFAAAGQNVFPYPLDTMGEIIGGQFGTGSPNTTYYFFYNWMLETSLYLCESDREEAVITVNELDVTATNMIICDGTSTDLSVTSINSDYTYTWYPGAMTGATVTVSPTSTTTYTVVADDAILGCQTEEQITIEVIYDAPTDMTVTPEDAIVCLGNVFEISAQEGAIPGDITWSPLTDLYMDMAATIPYDGSPATTVYFEATTSGLMTYTATLTNACGFTSETVEIDVPDDAAPTGNANQEFVTGSGDTVSDLNVTGTDFTWYSDAAGTNTIPDTTPLVDGTTYYVSQTIDGCESQLLAITVTEFFPCDEPTALASGAKSTDSAEISWTASATETGGYNWFVFNTGDNPATATPVTTGTVASGTTTAIITGLDPDTTYDFYVSTLCTGAGNESDMAGPLAFTTDPLPCDAPAALNMVDVTDTTVEVSWSASANETDGYAWGVYNVGDNPVTDTPVTSGTVATGITTAMASGLNPSTAYDFYVSTLCAGGEVSDPSDPLTFTTSVPLCDVPTNIVEVEVTDTTVEYTWTASASETNGYDWVVFNEGDDPTTDTPVVDGSVASGMTSVIITGLAPETVYDFYVRTNCDPNGFSDWEGPHTFTTETMSIRDNVIEGFAFYPNPMADVINISAKNTIDEVMIFNLIGQKLIDRKIGVTTAQLDVSSFASGPYLMQVTSNGQTGVYRIIKK